MTGSKRPCGRRFCPAAIRVLYPVEELRLTRIGAALGLSAHSVARQADWLGLKRRRPNYHKPVSVARMRKLYVEADLSIEDLGRALGMHPDTAMRKAKAMGLEKPSRNNYRHKITWPADFNQMWLDGVLIADIMAAAKTDLTDIRCVSREARRRGLPPRTKNRRWSAITITDWNQMRLGAKLAQAARIEQAAFIAADLADRVIGSRYVGHEHARGAG